MGCVDQGLVEAAEVLFRRLAAARLRLATAESCTGGLIAAAMTEIPGSSAVLERGFVTYSNAAKSACLGVPADLVAEAGAVSEGVARAMAEGALAASNADVSVAVTGIAGPDGGTAEKPVGLVHIAAAGRGRRTLHERHAFGAIGRSEVRRLAVLAALRLADRIAG